MLSVSALSLASPSCRLHSNPDSAAAPLGFGSSLSDKCHVYFTQDLALLPSTRKVIASSQCRFLDFCAQDNSLSPSESALSASEDLLIRFCSHLTDTLHHSSIKVYLSAIQSLHVVEGLPSPLAGCLQLQCELRGIKCYQGSNKHQRQPITIELMHNILQPLHFSDYNHRLQCFGLPAVSGFLVSYVLVSSPSTPTSIPTSTLVSAMSKQIL